MNQTLHDAFAHGLDDAGRLDVDVEALVDRGETRLRHRRLSTLLGSIAAVALVAAAVAGVTAGHPEGRGDGPVNHPDNNPAPSSTRPIVYSDVRWGGSRLFGDSIHVGDRVVDTGSGWIHMDVTDDGVVYATGGYTDDGRVWFTDGGTPEQIGSHACNQGHGFAGTVVTGNSGSLAAWIDCTRAQNPDLVVYDTGSGREAAREQVAECGKWVAPCIAAHAIIGDHVYLTWTHRDGATSLLEFDMATGRVSKVEPKGAEGPEQSPSYLDDIRSQPRSLVIGDSWETGTPTLAAEFDVVGKKLVPSSDGPHPSVFDSATRQPIRLHLPPGYRAANDEDPVDFWNMQWLDDDTIALVGRTAGFNGSQAGDIVTCRLSSGRCELAVPALPGKDRIVPNQFLW